MLYVPDWKITMCPADNNIDTVVEPSTATMTSTRGARLSSHNTGLYATGNYAKTLTEIAIMYVHYANSPFFCL